MPMSIMKEGSTPPLLNSNCPMVWFPPSGFEEQLRLQAGLPRFEDVPARCNFSYYLDALSSYNTVQVQPSETPIKKEKDDVQLSAEEEQQRVERRRAMWRAAHRRRAERKREELRKQLEEQEAEKRKKELKAERNRAIYKRWREDPAKVERKRAQWRATYEMRKHDLVYTEKRRAQGRAAYKRKMEQWKESQSSSSNPKGGRQGVERKPKGRSQPPKKIIQTEKKVMVVSEKEAQQPNQTNRKSSRHKDNPSPPRYSET